MADNFLIPQPNGYWAKMRSIDVGGGVQVPVVSGPTLTPEQFGAKGDGIADDTVPMQEAMDAVPANGALLLHGGARQRHNGRPNGDGHRDCHGTVRRLPAPPPCCALVQR